MKIVEIQWFLIWGISSVVATYHHVYGLAVLFGLLAICAIVLATGGYVIKQLKNK